MKTETLRLEILSRETTKHSTVIYLIDQHGHRRLFYATDFIDGTMNGMCVLDGEIYGEFREACKGGTQRKCLKYVPQ